MKDTECQGEELECNLEDNRLLQEAFVLFLTECSWHRKGPAICSNSLRGRL